MQLRNLIDSQWAQFQGYAPPVGRQKLTAGIVQGGNGRYLIWQQASLPRLLKPWRARCVSRSLQYGASFVAALHPAGAGAARPDPARRASGPPLTRARIVNSYRRRLIPLSVARSSYVLTVSEFSRDRILEHFPEARVIVIPCTIPESWFVGAGQPAAARQLYPAGDRPPAPQEYCARPQGLCPLRQHGRAPALRICASSGWPAREIQSLQWCGSFG